METPVEQDVLRWTQQRRGALLADDAEAVKKSSSTTARPRSSVHAR